MFHHALQLIPNINDGLCLKTKKTGHTGRFRYSLLKDVSFRFCSRSVLEG
jgi:hypothetical protein